jgi:hypothetical protein
MIFQIIKLHWKICSQCLKCWKKIVFNIKITFFLSLTLISMTLILNQNITLKIDLPSFRSVTFTHHQPRTSSPSHTLINPRASSFCLSNTLFATISHSSHRDCKQNWSKDLNFGLQCDPCMGSSINE